MALLCALLTPAAAQAQQYLPPDPVPPGKGFGFNTPLFPAGEGNRVIDAAVATGATHMRMSIHWRSYEAVTNEDNPVPPSFSLSRPLGQPTGHGDTDRIDKEYLALTSRGITPIIMMNSVPAWASTFHTCLTNPLDALDAKKCPKDWRTQARILYPAVDRFPHFKEFVMAAARRYPKAIFEGNNEPDYNKMLHPQYHPHMGVIAGGQCTLANGVRAVDPNRHVLSPGFFNQPYTEEFLKQLPKSHICFTHLSYHPSGSTQIRVGPASAPEAILKALRLMQGNGRPIWITETGLSSYVEFNDEQFREDTVTMGETRVARALPRWVHWFAEQPDVAGVLIHTLRQVQPGSEGESLGRGLLNFDWTVRPTDAGTVPRFCYFVLAAGNTYPGCEGYSLPASTPQTKPSFFVPPYLITNADTGVGGKSVVLFLEEGNPIPETVNIRWMSCNALGEACVERARQTGHYITQPNDRLRRLKVVVTLRNANGAAGGETLLGPVIRG